MLYAALGDSITHGYGSTTANKRYVARIERSLAKHQLVNTYVLAKPGWTSKQLLKAVRATPACIWGEARLVTLFVGGNDLLKTAPWALDGNSSRVLKIAEEFRDNLAKIVQTVSGPKSRLLIANIYNPFPNSVMAETYTDMLNKVIESVAQRKGTAVVDVRQCFSQHEDRLIEGYRRGSIRDFRLLKNPIHPNDAGHEAIADAFLQAYHKQRRTRAKSVRAKSRPAVPTPARIAHTLARGIHQEVPALGRDEHLTWVDG